MAINRTVGIGLEFEQKDNQLSTIIKQLEKINALSGKKKKSVTLSTITKQAKEASVSVGGLNKSLVKFSVASMAVRKSIRLITGDYAQLEKAVYDLGIVSDMSVGQIRNLKYELIDITAQTKISAREMSEAANMVQRTGQNFEDSMKITQAGMKLAVASGEDLSKTLDVTTKALVAFGVEADNSEETFNRFHSAVLNTPLTLEKLGASLNNSASAYKNFIDMSSMSGKELDDYKDKLLAVNVALTGGLAKQGVPAATAGVTQRMMVTKLLAPEKTAKLLIDQQLKANQVFDPDNNNVILSMERISEIARQDLPRAINLMSKLYTSGSLSFEAMSKLFTIRHSPKILSLLTDVNGELDKYVKNTTEGRDITEDSAKAMESWDSIIKQTQNSLVKLSKPLQNFADRYLKDTVKSLNEIVNSMDGLGDKKSIALVEGGFISLTKALLGVVGYSKIIKPALLFMNSGLVATGASAGVAAKGFQTLNASLGVIGMAIMAANLAIDSFISYQKQIEEENLASYDANMKFVDSLKEIRKSIKESGDAINKYKNYLSNLKRESSEMDLGSSLFGNYEAELKTLKKTVNEIQSTSFKLSSVSFTGGDSKELDGTLLKIKNINKEIAYITRDIGGDRGSLTSNKEINKVLKERDDLKLKELELSNKMSIGLTKSETKLLQDTRSRISEMDNILENLKSQNKEGEKLNSLMSERDRLITKEVNLRNKASMTGLELELDKLDEEIEKRKKFKKEYQELQSGTEGEAWESWNKKIQVEVEAIQKFEEKKVKLQEESVKEYVDYVKKLESLNAILKDTFTSISSSYLKDITFSEEYSSFGDFKNQLEKISPVFKDYVSQWEDLADLQSFTDVEKLGFFKSSDFNKVATDMETIKKAFETSQESLVSGLKNLGLDVDPTKSIEGVRLALEDLINSESNLTEEQEKTIIALLNTTDNYEDYIKSLGLTEQKMAQLIKAYKKSVVVQKSLGSTDMVKAQNELNEFNKVGLGLINEKIKSNRKLYDINKRNLEIERENVDIILGDRKDRSKIVFTDDKELKNKINLLENIKKITKEQANELEYYRARLKLVEKDVILTANKNLDDLKSQKEIKVYYEEMRKLNQDYSKTLLYNKEEELKYEISITKKNMQKHLKNLDMLEFQKEFLKLKGLERDLSEEILNSETKKRLGELDRNETARLKAYELTKATKTMFGRGTKKSDLESNRESLNTELKRLKIQRQAIKDSKEILDKEEKKNALNEKDKEILEAKHKIQISYIDALDIEMNKRKEMVGLALNYIEALSKGETIAFNSGQAIQGTLQSLTNLFSIPALDRQIANETDSTKKAQLQASRKEATLTKKDYLNLAIGGVGIFDNMMKQESQAKMNNLKFEMDILNMRSGLAMDDEERAKYQEELLRKQEQMIDAQYAQQTSFMGVSGSAGGALSGALGGFMTGGIVGGILGGITGLFGADKAKQEAERQKAMLREQERIRKLTEVQNEIMSVQTEYLKNVKDYGVDYARDEARKDFNEKTYETYIKQRMLEYDGRSIDIGRSQTTKSASEWEEILREVYPNKEDSFYKEMLSSKYGFSSSLKTIETNKLTPEEMLNFDRDKLKDDMVFAYGTGASEAQQAFIKTMNDTSVWKNFFGSDVEWNKDKEAFIDNGWEARKEYMDILASGVSDVEEQFGDSFTNMLVNAYRRNDALTTQFISQMEKDYGKLSEFIGNAFQLDEQADFTKLFNKENAENFKESNGELSTGNQHLLDIINDIKSIDERQREMNLGATDLLTTYTTLGGKISDASDLMGEFGNDIKEAMQNALNERNFIDRFNTLGSSVGQILRDNITEKLLDQKFSNDFIKINEMVNTALTGDTYKLADISRISQEISKYTARTEIEAQRLGAALDMMNLTDEINYIGQNQQVEYKTGSTSSIINNYNSNIELNVGNLLGDDVAMNSLVDKITSIQRDRSIGQN